jgi:hypothetical protein
MQFQAWPLLFDRSHYRLYLLGLTISLAHRPDTHPHSIGQSVSILPYMGYILLGLVSLQHRQPANWNDEKALGACGKRSAEHSPLGHPLDITLPVFHTMRAQSLAIDLRT